MILCVCPNPDVEHNWSVPGFHAEGVFRVQEELLLPSGKGVNVARAIHTLGGQALCFGFLAGHTGRLVAALAAAHGLDCRWTWVAGETRIAVAVLDPQVAERDATLISESGPQITPGDWERLSADLLSAAQPGDLVCFSGSFPPATPYERVEETMRTLHNLGCSVWVDSSGAGLQAALQAGAAGVKVNREEIETILGSHVCDVASARRAGEAVRAMGVGTALVTLGEAGAVLVADQGAWVAIPPAVPRVSTVGSGDAFLAGLLYGLDEGLSLPEALRCATAAGAANVRMPGGGRFRLEDYRAALSGVRVEELTG